MKPVSWEFIIRLPYFLGDTILDAACLPPSRVVQRQKRDSTGNSPAKRQPWLLRWRFLSVASLSTAEPDGGSANSPLQHV